MKLTITMWPGREDDVMTALAVICHDRILSGVQAGEGGLLKDDDGKLAVWELDEEDESS